MPQKDNIIEQAKKWPHTIPHIVQAKVLLQYLQILKAISKVANIAILCCVTSSPRSSLKTQDVNIYFAFTLNLYYT